MPRDITPQINIKLMQVILLGMPRNVCQRMKYDENIQ